MNKYLFSFLLAGTILAGTNAFAEDINVSEDTTIVKTGAENIFHITETSTLTNYGHLQTETGNIFHMDTHPDYTINLLQVLRKPEWTVKIFGFPIFQVQRSPMQLDPEELPVQKKVKKAEEIFYKICGLTFLKVEKKDLYG